MNATTRRPPARQRPAPLPRGGRHPLTQQAVAQSQRARMFLAVMHAVADKGYAATTVADVIAAAGVSRRTFYEHFANVEECFLAAYDEGVQQVFGAIRDALRGLPKADWRERSRAAIDAYLQALAAAPPGGAWAYSIEVLGAGRRALARRAQVMAQWVAQWRALVERRAADRIADETLLGLVGGIEEQVRECLRTRGVRSLPSLADGATALALRVLEPSPR
jgi:AcrR family transcriptional regulator